MSVILKQAYRQHSWVKIATFAGLVLVAFSLMALSGGFPPWAWRFLLATLPQLPPLWHAQGPALLAPLIGLCLLSLSLLILWVTIVSLMVKVLFHFWHDYQANQKLQEELRVAEILAEHDFNAHEETQADPAPFAPAATVAPVAPARAPARRVTIPIAAREQNSQYSQPPLHEREAQDYRTLPMRKAVGTTDEMGPAGHVGRAGATESLAMRGGGRSHYPASSVSRPAVRHDAGDDEIADLIARSSPPVPRIRQKLHLVPPSVPSSGEDEDELDEENDAADAQFIGREDEPDWDEAEEYLGAPISADLEDMGDVMQLVDLPLVSPADISRTPTSAIWGEQEQEMDALDEFEDDGYQPAENAVVREESGEEQMLPGQYQFARQPFLRVAGAANTESMDLPRDESSVRLFVGIGIDPGIARKDAPNEDSLFAMQGMRITDHGSMPAGLFVVADGMGGHANGREASRSAIRLVSDTIVPTLLRDVSGNSGSVGEEETFFVDMLKDGVHRANLELYRRNREVAHMMGTTLTSTMIVDTTAYIANIGDSRTYLYRSGKGLRQITRDHSVVAQMVESGLITREEVYTHPKRNQIYRCLGEHATVEVDTFVVQLQPDDVLLLCSDGLWEMVHDRDLEKIVGTSAHSPAQLSTLLVQAALNYGGADNISVVVVRVASAQQSYQ